MKREYIKPEIKTIVLPDKPFMASMSHEPENIGFPYDDYEKVDQI